MGQSSSGGQAKQKTAIVTGSASGLGRAICLRLARDGWEVALADVDEQANAETLRQLLTAGGLGHCESLDVSNPEQWEALLQRLKARWPHLDLLVNNAGVCGCGEIGSFSLDDWRWILNTNLFGTIYGSHTMVDWLKSNLNGGYIINSGSFASVTSAPGLAAYNVAKSGILSLSETLYTELMNHNVGVSLICPAFFGSKLLTSGRFNDELNRMFAQEYSDRAPFTAEQIADISIRAMQRKQFYVVPGVKARFFWRFKRWIPQAFLRSIGRSYPRKLAKFQASKKNLDPQQDTE